jgi:hypothetical protein
VLPDNGFPLEQYTKCTSPKLKYTKNLVSGIERPSISYADLLRAPLGECGPNGKLFEDKNGDLKISGRT